MRLLAIILVISSFLVTPVFAETPDALTAKIRKTRAEIALTYIRIQNAKSGVETGSISMERAREILAEEGKNLARFEAELYEYGKLLDERIQKIDHLIDRAKQNDTM